MRERPLASQQLLTHVNIIDARDHKHADAERQQRDRVPQAAAKEAEQRLQAGANPRLELGLGVVRQVKMQHDQSGHGAGRGWTGQPKESIGWRAIGFDVVTRQAHGRAGHIDRENRPEDAARKRNQLAGFTDQLQVGAAQLPDDHRRRHPEGDAVGQAVDLLAESADRFREPGHVAVEQIENHAHEDGPTSIGHELRKLVIHGPCPGL